MRNWLVRVTLFGAALLGSLIGLAALAQEGPRKLLPPELRPSPEVHPDRRVTFRLYAPKAGEVAVVGEFTDHKPQALKKDESGLWAVTVGPLTPDVHRYQFLVDGQAIPDPHNDWVTPGPAFDPKSSLVLVPGEKPMPWEARDVPHGTVHVHWYASAALGTQRRFHVYTPPGYGEGREAYPVLYLLHGSGDNDASWVVVGRVNFLLDNLLADGKAVPMVIVMPFGHVPDAASLKGWTPERELVEAVLPLVERAYRVKTDRESRAVAGVSMGGGQALRVAVSNLDRFAWVGAFSAGGAAPEELLYRVRSDPRQLNKLRLLWVGCGKDDFLYQENQALIDALDKNGIKHVWRPTDGGHTWSVWRDDLLDFAPLLFGPADRPPK